MSDLAAIQKRHGAGHYCVDLGVGASGPATGIATAWFDSGECDTAQVLDEVSRLRAALERVADADEKARRYGSGSLAARFGALLTATFTARDALAASPAPADATPDEERRRVGDDDPIVKAAYEVYMGEIGLRNPKDATILALGAALFPHRRRAAPSPEKESPDRE